MKSRNRCLGLTVVVNHLSVLTHYQYVTLVLTHYQ